MDRGSQHREELDHPDEDVAPVGVLLPAGVTVRWFTAGRVVAVFTFLTVTHPFSFLSRRSVPTPSPRGGSGNNGR